MSKISGPDSVTGNPSSVFDNRRVAPLQAFAPSEE